MTKYWVSIIASGISGYFTLGFYVEFNDKEYVNEKSVRSKVEEYFDEEREKGKSSFSFNQTYLILGWSKCE